MRPAMFSHHAYYRWRRRRRRRAAMLLLALVVVAGAVIGQAGAHSSGTTTRVHQEDGARHGQPRPAHQAAKVRYAAAAAAGRGLSWVSFHGIGLPRSSADGPAHMSGGLAWGFADTPGGAVVAAVNIGVRTAALWGPDVFVSTVRRQVTGPGRGALLRGDRHDYAALRNQAHVAAGQPAGRGYAVEAAYRFVTWSTSAATVDIVTEGPTTSSATAMVATRVELVWRHGDWRVLAPPGGRWASSATRISSLSGYTTFVSEG